MISTLLYNCLDYILLHEYLYSTPYQLQGIQNHIFHQSAELVQYHGQQIIWSPFAVLCHSLYRNEIKINGIERKTIRKHELDILMASFHLGRQSRHPVPSPRAISLLYLINSFEKSQLKFARGVFIVEKKKIRSTYGKRGFRSRFYSKLISLIHEENTWLSFEKQSKQRNRKTSSQPSPNKISKENPHGGKTRMYPVNYLC